VRGTCSMLHVMYHEPSLWRHVASKVEQPGVLQRLHVTLGDLPPVFWQDAWTMPLIAAQFDADCRPFLIAGFNAHHLVTNVLVLPTNHRTPGEPSHRTCCHGPAAHAASCVEPAEVPGGCAVSTCICRKTYMRNRVTADCMTPWVIWDCRQSEGAGHSAGSATAGISSGAKCAAHLCAHHRRQFPVPGEQAVAAGQMPLASTTCHACLPGSQLFALRSLVPGEDADMLTLPLVSAAGSQARACSTRTRSRRWTGCWTRRGCTVCGWCSPSATTGSTQVGACAPGCVC